MGSYGWPSSKSDFSILHVWKCVNKGKITKRKYFYFQKSFFYLDILHSFFILFFLPSFFPSMSPPFFPSSSSLWLSFFHLSSSVSLSPFLLSFVFPCIPSNFPFSLEKSGVFVSEVMRHNRKCLGLRGSQQLFKPKDILCVWWCDFNHSHSLVCFWRDNAKAHIYCFLTQTLMIKTAFIALHRFYDGTKFLFRDSEKWQ